MGEILTKLLHAQKHQPATKAAKTGEASGARSLHSMYVRS